MEEKFLNPSMVHNTVEAYEIVCRLDHGVKLDESPQDKKKQKAAKALLSDELQSRTLPNRCPYGVSRIFEPVSRFRIAQFLPQMNLASCFSPWAHCWFLRHPSAMVFVRHKDVTLRERHRCVELAAPMNPTLFHTATNVLCCTTFLPQSADKPLFHHGEAIFSTT